MSDALRIGLARKQDIDAIHQLEVSAFPAPWRREFFESELRASSRFNLAAKRGDRLIGYLFAMWFLDEMHINKIAVIDSERRQGVARELMDHCFKFATMNRIRSISLEVRQSNLGARHPMGPNPAPSTTRGPKWMPKEKPGRVPG